MTLEQFEAYFADLEQDTLGPVERIGKDGYPLLESSDLKEEHALISEMFAQPLKQLRKRTLNTTPIAQQMLEADKKKRTQHFLAWLERVFSFEAKLSTPEEDFEHWNVFAQEKPVALLEALYDKGVDVEPILLPTLQWIAGWSWICWDPSLLEKLLREVRDRHSKILPAPFRSVLLGLVSFTRIKHSHSDSTTCQHHLVELLGRGVWNIVLPGEVWTDRLIESVQSMPDHRKESWANLLAFLGSATASKPAPKWNEQLRALLHAVGESDFRTNSLAWLGLIDKGRTHPTLSHAYDNTDGRQTIHPHNADIVRGMLWALIPLADAEVCRALGRVGLSAYRKIRGVGPRAVKVGNAAVYALGEIGSADALAQLAILKVRVKFGTAQKGIEKALDATAKKVGISREELEEMSVPAYGLSEVGLSRQELGEFTAELVVAGSKSELKWFDTTGKQRKSVPSAVKSDFGDELKDLKQAGKDIDKMIPAQVARIEQLYLQQKEWDYPTWRERYLDHPLVGTIARRLIWRFQRGKKTASAMWDGDKLVDSRNKPVAWIDDKTKVSLWHPLLEPSATTARWREWLETHEVRQPFKQAHREVYILTDAERDTNVYSNRFAAHILKQHQFNALCAARGWKNKLRLMVDDSYPPAHLELPLWNLRAEFWIESVGDDYGTDTNESGTLLHVSTDQVRFYPIDAAQRYSHAWGGGYFTQGLEEDENHPLALDTIPELVFSEVMRDVDLFVGVASVANDPTWSDGGPEGRYLDYWQRHSFGDLGATAKTRKTVLERIVPRLKIADRCTFSEKFLVVRGDIRSYKIHLGSGNILMTPNDQYLCIVPKQSVSKAKANFFLPFEGDNMLSVILSKALLLADDKKITDSTITSQIGKG